MHIGTEDRWGDKPYGTKIFRVECCEAVGYGEKLWRSPPLLSGFGAS